MRKLIRSYPLAALFVLLLLLTVFGVNIATVYTDWLWFGETGYTGVFTTMVRTRAVLGGVFGLVAFALLYANLRLAARFRSAAQTTRQAFVFDQQGRPRTTLADAGRRALAAAFLLGSLAFAFVAGLSAAGRWDVFLRARHATPFGVVDPVFGRDIGFYVFHLPFLRFAQSWLLTVSLLVLAVIAVLYLFQQGIDLATGKTRIAPHVRAHLSGLAALALCAQAGGYYLSRFDLLTGGGSLFTGAGYTDLHARLPLLNVLMGVTALAALLVLVNIRQRSLVLPGAALAVWAASSLLGVVIPGFVQGTVVRPNQAQREAPFIARALASTRAAYNIDQVAVQNFEAAPDLSAGQVAANPETISNIRLWDYAPLLETYPQQQSLRQYYAFPDVDIDRYRAGDRYRQVWLAAREINPRGLDARAQTWPNLHLRYTHGFGVVMSLAGEVSEEGLPPFLLKDIPTVSSVPGLNVKEPRIYYGLQAPAGSYVVTNTRQTEFDYPSDTAGVGDKENRYTGRGGVRLSPLAKIAFAVRFNGWTTLMLSRDLAPESRLLFARRVPDRVRRVAPFLHLDADAYPVVSASGRVVWIQDAYTTTNAYPYAARQTVTPPGEGDLSLNYIRNAVKATVDAYDGTITLYAQDERDPILQTYAKAFPGLIQPLSAMPVDLRAHRRYPEDLFSIQRSVLADYHVTDPQVFYARTDSWEIARERPDVEADGGTGGGVMAPYYLILRLPGQTRAEFVLLSPLTNRNRPNLSALLAARCDEPDYGKLVLYRLPPKRSVYGPEQIGARIRQDSKISPYLSLVDQKGSRVLFGNMLVVPIEKSLLYVQPLYVRATQQGGVTDDGSPTTTAIPELKQVVVAFENRIAMEPTLPAALRSLFGEGTTPAPPTGQAGEPRPAAGSGEATTRAPLIEQAGAQYDQARAALRRGDFAAYGREIEALGQTLARLRALEKGTPARP